MGLSNAVLGTDDATFLKSQSVQIILLVSVVSSMSSVASPALPMMTETLGISPSRIGLVFTAYTLPGVFLLPVVGAIAGVYGQRLVATTGLLLFGIGGLSVGLTTDFETILLLRAIQGSGYAAFNPLTVSLLGTLLSGQEEAASQGVRSLLNKLSGFLGPTVAGVLASVAWYYPFFLYAVAIPVGVLVFVALSNGEDDEDDALDDTGISGFGQYATELLTLLKRPLIVTIVLGGFFRMFLKYTFYTFIALVVVDQFNSNTGIAGLLIGAYSLIGGLFGTQAARIIDRFGHVHSLIVAFVVASGAFAVFALTNSLVVVVALVVVHGIGEGIINPVHKSILTQSVGDDVRVGLVTTNGIAQSIGRTVTPVVLSPLVLFPGVTYSTLFSVSGTVTLVVVVLFAGLLQTGALALSVED
jgi:MFS family permease